MTPNQRKAARKAVAEHFADLMPKRVEKLARLCYWDLMFGPLQECEDCGANVWECSCAVKWPGFENASIEVSDWAREHVPGQMFYDADVDYLSTNEPESTYECGACAGDGCEDCDGHGRLPEYLEETYVLDRREVLALLFGKELVNYL